MRIGIIVDTNDPEVVWTAFRVGNVALQGDNVVKVFLMNKGEAELEHNGKFNLLEQSPLSMKDQGQIYVCSTCLKVRQKNESDVCSISTMKDLLKVVEESDKLVAINKLDG